MLTFNKITCPTKSPYSAQEIALFLLSLDPDRKYFFNRKLNGFFAPKISNFTMGNFRLNAHLQIAQMLYYAHYQQPLFADKIKAYEHGGYVEEVYHNFPLLLQERKTKFHLDKKTKEFLTNLFHYLKTNYTNRDLEYFVYSEDYEDSFVNLNTKFLIPVNKFDFIAKKYRLNWQPTHSCLNRIQLKELLIALE
ncbi:36879_t:CDS:2, partial [Gigaspora margarita]